MNAYFFLSELVALIKQLYMIIPFSGFELFSSTRVKHIFQRKYILQSKLNLLTLRCCGGVYGFLMRVPSAVGENCSYRVDC